MATTGTHVGGRPSTEQDNRRDLAETALFEIGEGRSVLADMLVMSRQLSDLVREAQADTERARAALDNAMKTEARALVLNENVKRFASLRLRELVIEEEHLVRLAEAMGIDKIRPALELVKS